MSVLPLVFTSGWASGINAYAVVLLLGIFGATGLTDDVPASLQRTDVLIAAAILFLCEAVADKIPYVDSIWDAVHTVVRPLAGAVIGALLAGQSGSLSDLSAAALGGSTALASHFVKAGTRMAINSSPEPFTNVAMSIAEDLASPAWSPSRSSTRCPRRSSRPCCWPWGWPYWSSSGAGSAASCTAGRSAGRRSGWPPRSAPRPAGHPADHRAPHGAIGSAAWHELR